MTRLNESEERLVALVGLQSRIKKAVKVWRKMPDAVPTGDSICHLIEAVMQNEDLDRRFD